LFWEDFLLCPLTKQQQALPSYPAEMVRDGENSAKGEIKT